MIIQSSGFHAPTLWLREDGIRLDRLLLTTDTTYLPTGFGPVESVRQTSQTTGTLTNLVRTISYTYDDRYRLTAAGYTSGETYSYTYDSVGNRLEQIINGDTTSYTYDAANRLASVNGLSYTFDANGNLLTTGTLTNTWDAANRLIQTSRDTTTIQPIYDGLGNRVAQTAGVTTTYYALDTAIGLPEVLYTSEGNAYLHLPGIIVAESNSGETRYLLSDGLGSVRHAVDETAVVVSYKEFDPYGNPLPTAYSLLPTPYGFTGEWWEDEAGLLYLRARWYLPETGAFLSRDAVESEPPYQYVRGNVVNLTDPSGMDPCTDDNPMTICYTPPMGGDTLTFPSFSTIQPVPPFPDCDPGKPCQVILGAIRVETFGEILQTPYLPWWGIANEQFPYHHFVLVADPNNIQREGLPMPKPYKGTIPIGNFVTANDNITVYDFSVFAETVLIDEDVLPGPDREGPWNFGYVIPQIKLHQESLNFVEPNQWAVLNPQYELKDASVNCDDILACFRKTTALIANAKLNYNALGTNSNTFAKTLLRSCGLSFGSPVNNVVAPGWYAEYLLK